METKPVKLVFGWNYWFAELVAVGEKIEPGKYSAGYISQMRTRYAREPFTTLVQMVQIRRELLKNLQPAQQ